MPGHDPALEAAAEHGLGEVTERLRRGIARLVDVQVDVQAVCFGSGQKAVEVGVELGPLLGEHAQNAIMLRHEPGQLLAVGAAIVLGGIECHALERDAVSPALAQLGEDGPADLGLRRHGIDMGADGAGAVREGAAERELHAVAHVIGTPGHMPVALHGLDRGREAAVKAGGPRPDMALVEMRVHVDRAGPDHAALEVDGGGVWGCWMVTVYGGKAAVLDRDVEQKQPVGIGRAFHACGEACRHMGGQPVSAAVADRSVWRAWAFPSAAGRA